MALKPLGGRAERGGSSDGRTLRLMYRVISCLSGEHDLRLVGLAVFICLLASFVGLKLLGHARANKGEARVGWLALAGLATGCGIWVTHFIGMLAYEPGV